MLMNDVINLWYKYVWGICQPMVLNIYVKLVAYVLFKMTDSENGR